MAKHALAERAQMCRNIARGHRQMAREAIAVAEQCERDAALMDQGIDPFENGKRREAH